MRLMHARTKVCQELAGYFLVGLITAFVAGTSRVQGSEPPGMKASASGPAGPLRPEEVLSHAERHYPKILKAILEQEVAASKILEKKGAFDPVLSLRMDELGFEEIPGKDKDKEKLQATIDWLTPQGIKVFAGGRRSTTRPVLFKDDELTRERLFLGFKLPLFRGAGINEKRLALEKIRLGEPLARVQHRMLRLEVLELSLATYWDWVASARMIPVVQVLLSNAEARAAGIQSQADAGDLPPIRVVEARMEVAKRRELLAKVERKFQATDYKLALFLWEMSTPRTPPSDLVVVPPPGETSGALESMALRARPEMEGLALARRSTEFDQRFARNIHRPQVDLTLNPGRESEDDVIEPIERRFKYGVVVSLPLNRREARGQLSAARVKMQQIEADSDLTRRQIVMEVRDALSEIRAIQSRLAATEAELELARALEEGERQEFEAGMGTLFLVFQRERARAEVELKLIEILAENRKADIRLRAATASL